MIKWIHDINWGKLLLAAILYTIVAMIVHTVESMLMMSFYIDPNYFGVWSKVMMPTAGPPPAAFFITSLVITFVSGLSLGLIYYYIRTLLPKNFWKRVTFFADLLIGASFIFFTLPSYLMFNVPGTLLISWFVSGFVILCTASFTFAKLLK